MNRKKCESHEIKIFIAGDIVQIKQVIREYCQETGFCVTVSPTTYIYTGGEEEGVVIGIINYPRFPSDSKAQFRRACYLAGRIKRKCNQSSFTVMSPERTWWFYNEDRKL